MEGFTKLEEAALLDVCLQCTTDQAAALTVQLSTAKVRSRENTGAGFYTRFDVARDRPIPGEWKRPIGWTYVEGLTRPMGFILWIRTDMPTASKASLSMTAPSDLTLRR